MFRKKSPVIKIYFPRNDTPTTNEGFRAYDNMIKVFFFLVFSLHTHFSCIFPPHPLFLLYCPVCSYFIALFVFLLYVHTFKTSWSNFNENKSAKDYIPLFSKSFQKLQTMIEKMIHHCLEKIPYKIFLNYSFLLDIIYKFICLHIVISWLL